MAFLPAAYRFTTDIYFIDYNTNEHLNYGNCLTGIAIKKDYSSNIFPLYVLNMLLSHDQKQYLSSHKFYVSLKIYRCPISDDEESEDTKYTDPITDKVVASLLLRPFDPSTVVAQFNESETNDIKKSQDEQLEPYTIYCIPKDELKINNSILNSVYTNANLNEIVINSISEVYTKDIYYQESQNTNRYESLLIPPMSLVPALRYLQRNYMIYKNNINIFFDDSKLYIYDILDSARQFDNSFFIEIQQDNDTQQEMYRNNYFDGDNVKKYYNQNPLFVSNKDKYRYMTGDQVVYNSYDENFNLVSRSYDLSDGGNIGLDKKTRYMWNDDQKQDFEEPIKNKLYVYTTVNLYNIDPSLFTPATQINISGAQNTSFVGNYILLSSEEFYGSNDRKVFTNSIALTLAKR